MVQVGNSPPEIEFVLEGNQSFFLGRENIAYSVNISDREDEADGGLDPEKMKIRFEYIPDGNDLEVVLGGSGSVAGSMAYLAGEKLMRSSDCKSCHDLKKQSVGPSYIEVAERYDPTPENIKFLAGKIISGGNGNWGEKDHGRSSTAYDGRNPGDGKIYPFGKSGSRQAYRRKGYCP